MCPEQQVERDLEGTAIKDHLIAQCHADERQEKVAYIAK